MRHGAKRVGERPRRCVQSVAPSGVARWPAHAQPGNVPNSSARFTSGRSAAHHPRPRRVASRRLGPFRQPRRLHLQARLRFQAQLPAILPLCSISPDSCRNADPLWGQSPAFCPAFTRRRGCDCRQRIAVMRQQRRIFITCIINASALHIIKFTIPLASANIFTE